MLLCPLMSLLMHLKEYRQLRSSLDKIPIYCIFGDTVMRSIAQARPLTVEALLGVRGVTKEKCEQYGSDIVQIVGRVVPSEPVPLKPVGPCVWARKSVVRRKTMHTAAPLLQNRAKPLKLKSRPEDQIYILELSGGRVYVGRTSDMSRRVSQHLSGRGSAFTQAFPPTGALLPRLGRVSGSAEAAERDETLRYMFLHGIDLVRGWKYTRVVLPENERVDAEENIRELFDLCRRCGRPGHFITQCRAMVDREGKPVRPK
jgi:predicted GIY-YIG superfamily endonuclease